MTRTSETKKLGLRRFATITAAIGMLVMSSGVALMVSASPASAANKVGICHATGSDSNPYVFISVDDDSVKDKGHLQHRNNPNKKWKADGDFNGVPHVDGGPKPDLIGSFTDDQGVFHQYDGNITAASCEYEDALASVTYEEPSCANQSTASYATSGKHVTFSLAGTVGPGNIITVTATTKPFYKFAGGSTVKVFPQHQFDPAVDLNAPPCTVIPLPLTDATATATYDEPSCDNLNDVGYNASGDHIDHFEIVDGGEVAGGTITIRAFAEAGHAFAGGSATFDLPQHQFDPALDLEAECGQIGGPDPDADTTASVNFVDPSCANDNDASYSTAGDHVAFEVTAGSDKAGKSIEITATADPNHTFANGKATKVFSHTFGAKVGDCTNVITPTLVHAGLVNNIPTVDPRGQQGLALLIAGMVLMVLAGGLGLARPLIGRARN